MCTRRNQIAYCRFHHRRGRWCRRSGAFCFAIYQRTLSGAPRMFRALATTMNITSRHIQTAKQRLKAHNICLSTICTFSRLLLQCCFYRGTVRRYRTSTLSRKRVRALTIVTIISIIFLPRHFFMQCSSAISPTDLAWDQRSAQPQL